MKNYPVIISLMIFSLVLLSGCSEEDPETSISLSETDITAEVGNKVEIIISITTIEDAEKLTVEKTRGGVVASTETFTDTELSATFQYSDIIELEDSKSTLVYQFKIYSKNSGNVADQVDLVVTIEQSPLLILLDNDWKLTSSVLESNGAEDIRDFQKDDIMRFHEDHSYDVDFGAIVGFFDGYNQYCAWTLDEYESGDTLRYTWYTREPVLDGRHCKVLELSRTSMVLKYFVDLSMFNMDSETFTDTYVPLDKTEDFVPYRGFEPYENEECIPSEIFDY